MSFWKDPWLKEGGIHAKVIMENGLSLHFHLLRLQVCYILSNQVTTLILGMKEVKIRWCGLWVSQTYTHLPRFWSQITTTAGWHTMVWKPRMHQE